MENQKSKGPTPEALAKSGSEDGEQLAIFCWCALPETRQAYPELRWLFHCPNGGSRHKVEAGKLKAMGVKPGVPDLWFPVRRGSWPGLIIEMKKIKGGFTSNEQKEWIALLKAQGYAVMVCKGWIEARDTLIQYLNWR